MGLLEDLSKRLKKLETATAAEKKRNSGRGRANNNYAPRPPFIPNAKATEFVPNKQSNFNNDKQNIRPYVPPQNTQQNNAASRIDTANAPVCYFHQTSGDKARTCRNPCAFSLKLLSQSKVATLASGGITETRHDFVEATLPKLFHSKLLYVADKNNKCKYLIDTGAAVSVLPKSCANRISDADCLPLVAANNTTINTYGNSKRVVDVGLKRDYPWTFIVADVQQPIIDYFAKPVKVKVTFCGKLVTSRTLQAHVYVNLLHRHVVLFKFVVFNLYRTFEECGPDNVQLTDVAMNQIHTFCGRRIPWSVITTGQEGQLAINVHDNRRSNLLVFYSAQHLSHIHSVKKEM